ncbi:hypothetical protein KM043_004371 [Ampulex compressa]|nr:hypothetical protein KM043_004371 [Ampulex compressa]
MLSRLIALPEAAEGGRAVEVELKIPLLEFDGFGCADYSLAHFRREFIVSERYDGGNMRRDEVTTKHDEKSSKRVALLSSPREKERKSRDPSLPSDRFFQNCIHASQMRTPVA